MSTSLQILLFIAIVILSAKIAGTVAGRFRMPLVLGELIAGLILGPTVLNIGILPCFVSGSNAIAVGDVFKIISSIGVVLLMFLAGLETDVVMMRRAVAPAFWAAVGGVVLPMLGGCLLALRAGYSWQTAIFVGTILTATSVTITAQTLMNLNQIRSTAGSTILGAAVIDDVLGLIILSLVIALGPHRAQATGNAWTGLVITLARMAGCLIILFWWGPALTRWILQQARRVHGPHTEVAAALVIALLFAFQSEWLGGMAAITGAYLAGLFIAHTPAHETVKRELSAMTNSFFGPLFFVSIGLEVNGRQLGRAGGFFVLLLAIAIVGKIVGCGLGARLNRFSNRDSLIVGIGMIPRGEVGLITASLGWAAGLVTQQLYMQVVILVVFTTLITPGLLKFAFAPEPDSSLLDAPALGGIRKVDVFSATATAESLVDA